MLGVYLEPTVSGGSHRVLGMTLHTPRAPLFPTERFIQSRKYPALFFPTAANLFPNRQNSLTVL